MIKFPIFYKNGTYKVVIFNDGTKIQNGDTFVADRPETIDFNLSNYCENNCAFCYLGATKEGKHGELIKNGKLLPYLESIPKYTELAINYAKHPDLDNFIRLLAEKEIIVNLTINEVDFIKDFEYLAKLQKKGFIQGIGISYTRYSKELMDKVNVLKNCVFHIIVGVTPLNSILKLPKEAKLLLLGYKSKGRGKRLIPNISLFRISLKLILKSFNLVSFDNLAIEQLNVKNMIPKKDWERSYLGEEGTASFFIDSVEKKFYKSSLEESGTEITDLTVTEMFKSLTKER